ncbi:MAG TPA: hypothetical protein VGR95_03915, partial [Thermoanaerobaculia bacterium]|nr:hypothetical protein [Thermoanaerobaculia bacterium]
AKDANGQKVPNAALVIEVDASTAIGTAGEKTPTGKKINVTTLSDGTATVSVKPADKNTDVVVNVTPQGGGVTATFSWLIIKKVSIDNKLGQITPRTVYPDGMIITALGSGDKPAMFEQVRVTVVGGVDTQLFKSDDKTRHNSVDLTTDTSGIAKFSVETGQNLEVELRIDPLDADGKEVALGERTVTLSGLRKFDTFHSRRLFTELFLGSTFTNDYDTNGKSTGFDKTAPLARVTFDTLWYHRNQAPPPGRLATGSLWHTGVDMEFSSFPFGKPIDANGQQITDASKQPKGFDEAFSGSLFAVYQPDAWASYTPTSELTDYPTDALRFGVFGKIGMTTRPTLSTNGDSAITRGQIGLRFTHHQTKVDAPYHEQDNIVPIRFIEISYGKFEEFAGRKNANRLVLDAGFRLPGLGSNPIPFYAGIHLNGGRGPDDLRIFAGFLFKINEIATLFQGGTPGK